MAGKLSKAIWLETFELSSLSYLSLTGKMICRSKRLVNTDIWFNLIRGGSSRGMRAARPQGKGEWKSREFTHSCSAVLVALGQEGVHQRKCWLPGEREALPGSGSSSPFRLSAPVQAWAGLSWDWGLGLCTGLCWGQPETCREGGMSKYPFLPEWHRWGMGLARCQPTAPRISFCRRLWAWANLLVLMALLRSSLCTLQIYTKRN